VCKCICQLFDKGILTKSLGNKLEALQRICRWLFTPKQVEYSKVTTAELTYFE
jgi:hypothetical protein